jgi:hypothetical protein
MKNPLVDYSLSEIKVDACGAGIRFLLVSSLSPHKQIDVVCTDVLVFKWHRIAGDEAPYYIGELIWKAVSRGEAEQLLTSANYSFHDSDGSLFLQGDGGLYWLHCEGAICCDVLCKAVVLEEQ